MTERKRFSKAERARIFAQEGGVCHHCRQKVTADENYDISHVTPRWKDTRPSDDDPSNWKIIHARGVGCHKWRTSLEAAERAKELRRGKAKRPSRPIPGSKRSGVKCRLTSDGPRWEKR